MSNTEYAALTPGELSFDRLNPRLSKYDISKVSTKNQMATFIYDQLAIHTIINSIALAGYFPQRPITVAREHGHNVVLDGNRRLAAIMVITDPKLATQLRADVPDLHPDTIDSIQKLPAVITQRGLNWRYALNSHTRSDLNWPAGVRATYIQDLRNRLGLSTTEISHQGGYQARHSVLSLYEAAEVLQQAETTTAFHQDDTWSHAFFITTLYHALDRPDIRDFIGLGPHPADQQSPVPPDRAPQLEELMLWLYGQDSTRTKPLIQSTQGDLDRINTILQHPEAIQTLRDTRSISQSIERTKPVEPTFAEALRQAQRNIQQAETLLYRMDGPPPPHLLGLARQIAAEADNLHQRRRHHPNPESPLNLPESP